MRKILLIFCLLLAPARAQEEITQLSYFNDQFGNQASFWKVVVQGKTYVAFKLKSSDRTGEATVVMDKPLFDEFEQKVGQLKTASNPLKTDGIQVLWNKNSGEARVSTMLGRWNEIKVKLIQVEENKLEHQVTIDKSYGDFTRAVKKAKVVW